MITVKQFNDFVRNYSGENVKEAAEDFIYSEHNEFMWYGNPFREMFFADHSQLTISVKISELGKLMCQVYDYATLKKLYAFEMPETRGFSDTPKRRDTEIKPLDFSCAIREYIDSISGRQKVRPWELRNFAHPGDFGMTEDEFSEVCEIVCGY